MVKLDSLSDERSTYSSKLKLIEPVFGVDALGVKPVTDGEIVSL